MIAAFFPLKKLRRNGKHLLLGAIVLLGAVAVYHEMVAAKTWSSENGMNPDNDSRRAFFDQRGRSQPKDSAGWIAGFTPQLWKPEYKGQANLHVFEDWCGSSIDALRRNLHYPLYPHIRTTVSKLAVSPQWTNYGLRIFGYLHPYADGEFVFAVGSDDNSELWLSTDESPLNLQLLAWVGKTGSEWTAPGEFEKYASQISRPMRLFAQRRYFFEVIHKQNDKGSDHVEVAWQLLEKDFRLKIIKSKHISLYTDESALLINDVAHIPQTAASHKQAATEQHGAAAEMLREDPRDTFHQVQMINSKYEDGILPDCSYKPSYTIKDFPLSRYQGLQFVHLSYIYPNDFTRLTHMETERSCFYTESPYYMKMFGFSSYMRLDPIGTEERNAKDSEAQRGNLFFSPEEKETFNDEPYRGQKRFKQDHIDNAIIPDYGDDFDDYVQKRRHKLFSLDSLRVEDRSNRQSEHIENTEDSLEQPVNHHSQKEDGQRQKPEQIKLLQKKTKLESLKNLERSPRRTPPTLLGVKEQQRAVEPLERSGSTKGQIQTFHKTNQTQIGKSNISQLHSSEQRELPPEKPTAAKKRRFATKERNLNFGKVKRVTKFKKVVDLPLERHQLTDTENKNSLRNKEIELNMPLQQDVGDKHIAKINPRVNRKWSDTEVDRGQEREEENVYSSDKKKKAKVKTGERDDPWGQGWDLEDTDYEKPTPKVELDPVVTWNQTFQVNSFNLQALRSDWIDLNCNISGNLLLHSSDALPIVNSFMKHLNRKHSGRFTLLRVINVVKRVDGSYGSRYLLELELRDSDGQVVRLSRYIYALIRQSQKRRRDSVVLHSNPQILLCNPVGFRWNHAATVHFIVPVKNQARWVQQLIVDMEWLFRKTGDMNFNLIITDFNSTDMDVRKAMEKSSLPRYQYVKLSGNFERSAGLQAGIDLIDDDHSIVFLCDLHIHFPPSIIDTIRKHCVEGYMAFAPIVLRLDCGVTPAEARGYWEVNGFGLLGIYKSDLVAAGGMNTKEFTDRWGGEDWELLDRILQTGLEIDRIFLRNFFHHYHSKRGMWNRRMSTNHQ